MVKYKIKVLVFGGSGFIGINLINRLIEMNYDVTSFSKNIISNNKKIINVKYLHGDITLYSNIRNKLKNKKFDYVINLSGYGEHQLLKRGGIDVVKDHYIGNLNISNYFLNKKIKRFIQIGSSDEYGKNVSPQQEKYRE